MQTIGNSRMRTVRCSGCLSCHACPPPTMHAPCHKCSLPRMPPVMHAPLPCTHPPAMHAPPWTEFLTHSCEIITFPQLLLRLVTTGFILFLCINVNAKIYTMLKFDANADVNIDAKV